MSGIRVPDAQYEYGPVAPEMADVPTPKLPTASPEDFGTTVSAAGAKAGAEVQSQAVEGADKLIQVKLWQQQSEMYSNKENLRASQDDILHNNRTKIITDPDTHQQVEIPDGLLDRTGKYATNLTDEYNQRMNEAVQKNTPENMLAVMGRQYQRNFGSIVSLGAGKVSGYQAQQQKKTVDDSMTASIANTIKSAGDVNNIPDLGGTLHDLSEAVLKQQAFRGAEPSDVQEAQQKAYKQAIYNAAIGVVSKGGGNDAGQAMLGAYAKFLAPDDMNKMSDDIEKAAIGYKAMSDKMADIKQNANALDTIGKVADGTLGQQNIKDINTMNIPDRLKEAIGNALNSHPIATNAQGSQKPEDINLNELQGRLSQNREFISGQNKQFAKHLIDLANAPTQNTLVDTAVELFKSKSTNKITLEQQNIAAQLLAMRGQYLPVNADKAEGKEADSKQVAPTAALQSLVAFGKDKPGFTGMVKDYTTAISSGPQADPNAAKDVAIKNWVMKEYPQSVGKEITSVVSDGESPLRVTPMNYKPGANGKKPNIYPDMIISPKKKPSASVPNEA